MTENVTLKAYQTIESKLPLNVGKELGTDGKLEKNSHHQTVVYVFTPADKNYHRYFHSFSIDKQVEDFMGTCELRCTYDSDLMEYWEPIRGYCVVYGSNHGQANVKILFVGRVRGVKQEGYEIVVSLQDYGWKFKQMISQSYANDNIIGKDGYTILSLIFKALKIDSYVISPSAKKRLQQIGIDEEGNVTVNKKKIEKMPDLLKRLKASNPKDAINKDTVSNKLKESELHNINHINYTLQYEKPTKVMQKIASQGSNDYKAGSKIYNTNYTQKASESQSNKKPAASSSVRDSKTPPNWVCASVKNSSLNTATQSIWKFQRGYTKEYSWARQIILNYARNYPKTHWRTQVVPCLNTLAKYCVRKDKVNAAKLLKQKGELIAKASGITQGTGRAVNLLFSWRR